jgi:hypothetical protein
MNIRDAQFLNFTRSLLALPTWADYEVSGAVRKSEIKRQWRNAWRDDDAQRLLLRACHIEHAEAEQKREAERAAAPKPEFCIRLSLEEATELLRTDRAKYDRYEQWLIAFMSRPWPKKKPDGRDHDKEYAVETGEDLDVNERQSSGGKTWWP